MNRAPFLPLKTGMSAAKEKTPERVEVAVGLPVYGTYTYGMPEPGRAAALIGHRVLVPFGRRKVTGYVLGPGQAIDPQQVKPVLEVVDDAPLFPAPMVPFFKWIAEYYLHPLGEVIKCALPGGLTLHDVAVFSVTARGRAALSEPLVLPREKELLKRLIRRPATLRELKKGRDDVPPATLIHGMQRRGWVEKLRQVHGRGVRARTERFVALSAGPPPEGLTRQRLKILQFLEDHGEIPLRRLIRKVPTTPATVAALEKQGAVTLVERAVYRDPFGEAVEPDTPPRLTRDQREVVAAVTGGLGHGFQTFLLAGVTGSGKTEVYMQLAAEVVRRGYTVLVLIPEIALISQMERRFRARFGERIAVLHSRLSAGERYDQWVRIQRRQVSIALGARSAIFAPFSDIGLVIVDEEHDTSYKQEGSLRYNARDLAVLRAKFENGVALLGSATPSIQSYYNALQAKFTAVELPRRVEKRPLPKIAVVDLRVHRDQRGLRRFFSPELRQAMSATLDRHEQVLLFLNRRGFAGFAVCSDCGEAVRCRHCDISLTFHQAAGIYKCHYCGFQRAAPLNCSHCGSSKITPLGIGTEKVEDAVRTLFPEARVARMDSDTLSRKGSMVRLLKDLRHHRFDILVGTQMVAKGHDFPNITLVGIVCADLSLSFPDFRAGERTFQLLAQVAGRAGRGDAPGQVVLQTYNPSHFSITAAQQQDFRSFYDQEIRFRRALGYPPFARIILLRISGRDPDRTADHAHALGRLCHELRRSRPPYRDTLEILGPIEAALARIAGRYRWQIMLKGTAVQTLHRFVETLVYRHGAFFNHRSVKVAVDVDPFSVM
jgi:primosomal protein N' (replication factor Y)